MKLMCGKRNYVLTALGITKVRCTVVNTSAVSVMQNTIRCCWKAFVSHVVTEGSSESIVSAVVSTQTLSPTSQPCFLRDNSIGVHLVNESAINVRDAKGKLYTMDIDPCFQCSFVSDALCKRLQLSMRWDTLAVSGIGGNSAKFVKRAATLELFYQHDAKVKLKFSAYMLHIIFQYEPRMNKLCNSWSQLQGLTLADNFEFSYILLDGLVTLAGPISMGCKSNHRYCYLVMLLSYQNHLCLCSQDFKLYIDF